MKTSRQLRLRKLAIATVVSGSMLGAGFAPASADTNPTLKAASPGAIQAQNPGSIRGLKWKTEWLGGEPDNLGVRFHTQKLSYATAAYSVGNNGFRTVTLRMLAGPDLLEIHRTRPSAIVRSWSFFVS